MGKYRLVVLENLPQLGSLSDASSLLDLGFVFYVGISHGGGCVSVTRSHPIRRHVVLILIPWLWRPLPHCPTVEKEVFLLVKRNGHGEIFWDHIKLLFVFGFPSGVLVCCSFASLTRGVRCPQLPLSAFIAAVLAFSISSCHWRRGHHWEDLNSLLAKQPRAGWQSTVSLSSTRCWASRGSGVGALWEVGMLRDCLAFSLGRVLRAAGLPQPGCLSETWLLVWGCHWSIRKGVNWFCWLVIYTSGLWTKNDQSFFFKLENWNLFVAGPVGSHRHMPVIPNPFLF